jgi:hypothetical protein
MSQSVAAGGGCEGNKIIPPPATSLSGTTNCGALCSGFSQFILNFEAKLLDYMTFTVEVLDNHALNVLLELEQMHVIRLSRQQTKPSAGPVKKKEFKATRLDTRGFKFNREEANER